MSDPQQNNQNNNDDLEKAFQLIKDGKQQREDGENWDAADLFWQASKFLAKLAKEHPREDEEQEKIANLYQQKSQEYIMKTRETFMEAMDVEHEMDVENRAAAKTATDMEYCCQALSEDEARKRVEIFASIFAKELDELRITQQKEPQEGEDKKEEEMDVKQKQSSIEERLMELNANIPKGFKTSDERMQEINRGLNRLGLSLYTEGSSQPKIEPTKSASQQVADIIAQAKDEVAFEGHIKGGEGEVSDRDKNEDESEVSLSEDDSVASSGVDSVLSDEVPKLQNVKKIRNEVAAAQAKLAELVALMDTIPSPEEDEEAELDSEGKKSEPASFDPSFGKKTLKDAKDSLGKALKLWKVKAA